MLWYTINLKPATPHRSHKSKAPSHQLLNPLSPPGAPNKSGSDKHGQDKALSECFRLLLLLAQPGISHVMQESSLLTADGALWSKATAADGSLWRECSLRHTCFCNDQFYMMILVGLSALWQSLDV